jgi:hypothetical protein
LFLTRHLDDELKAKIQAFLAERRAQKTKANVEADTVMDVQ